MSIIMIYLLFAMVFVIWSDTTRFIIPNWLVASLVAVYPVAVYLYHGHVNWHMALVAMGIVFALGYIVFALKWMGAGDVKMITACSLWVGFVNLPSFIFLMAIFGGIFAGSVWLLRKALPFYPRALPNKPRILKEGQPIAYGVAIALAFLYFLYKGMVPN